MSEIHELMRELQDYPATDPRGTIYEPHPIGGFYCLIPVETRDKIVATLNSISERTDEGPRQNFERIIASLNYDGADTDSLTVGEIRRALP